MMSGERPIGRKPGIVPQYRFSTIFINEIIHH
jgi:hypothetical protein